MGRIQLAELTAFVAVAEHRSFTKAAAQVGIALPTMSQTIRSLEEELGVRLFNRTTRSVAPTEAGERLLAEVRPILDQLDHALESVNAFRDKPIGTLRLAVARSASVIVNAGRGMPLIEPFLAEYPGIRVEIVLDEAQSDIVGDRFDAGVRIGYRLERDMTILRISDDFRLLVAASPGYLSRHPAPVHPRDLHSHNCIRFRTPWDGVMQPWIFSRGEDHVEMAVDGSLVVNDVELMNAAALQGVGLAYVAEPVIADHVARGELVVVMADWSRTLPGVFLYHPSRRQPPMPLAVFIRYLEAWRSRSGRP
jgi:DNA-binding transcriptional LysR family regulator